MDNAKEELTTHYTVHSGLQRDELHSGLKGVNVYIVQRFKKGRNAQCFKSGLFEQWFKGDRDACAQCIGLIQREYFLGGLELHEEVMEF